MIMIMNDHGKIMTMIMIQGGKIMVKILGQDGEEFGNNPHPTLIFSLGAACRNKFNYDIITRHR